MGQVLYTYITNVGTKTEVFYDLEEAIYTAMLDIDDGFYMPLSISSKEVFVNQKQICNIYYSKTIKEDELEEPVLDFDYNEDDIN